MPCKKFRTFEEARRDLWNFYPDSEWIKKAFRLFRLRRFRKRKPVKRGITRFKTMKILSMSSKDLVGLYSTLEKVDTGNL